MNASVVPGMTNEVAAGLANLLTVVGDNKYYLGRWLSQWAVGAPGLESAVAAAAIAQGHLGQARTLFPFIDEFAGEGVSIGGPDSGRTRRYNLGVLDEPFATWAQAVAVLFLVDPALDVLLQCCGSHEWANRMVAERPFPSTEHLLNSADRNWLALSEIDWLEAYGAHPRIGERSASVWSQREQAGALTAEEETRHALAVGNLEYETRFGFIFVVFASGKTPEEMLELLRARISNDRDTEMRNAAAEQMKITRLRLERLLEVRT